jgi:hypothetical protein
VWNMRLLLPSRCFYPSIGGLERVSELLAATIWRLGIEVVVLTETQLGAVQETGPYGVIRRASMQETRKLIRGVALYILTDSPWLCCLTLYYTASLLSGPIRGNKRIVLQEMGVTMASDVITDNGSV